LKKSAEVVRRQKQMEISAAQVFLELFASAEKRR
jgi:hypothetical protein